MSKSSLPHTTVSRQSSEKIAATYCRVSTEDQGNGYSLTTQLASCLALAEKEGYTVPAPYRFADEVSGTTLDRSGLRQLRDLIRTHGVSAMIVHDPDRLSRTLGHQLLLSEELDQAGVRLLVVSHPLEKGPEGWLFFQMRGALAEYERAKIVERAKRGIRGRAKAGYPGGGQVPLGYNVVREPHKARWEIDPIEAALVSRIYAMCAQGMSCRTIAWQLSREQIPTRHDRKPAYGGHKHRPAGTWAPTTIHKILTNESYTGTTYFGRRSTPDERIAILVPPIVDTETFQAVQAQLRRNQLQAKRNRKQDYLLSGHLFCGQCGKKMSAHGSPHRRYRCSTFAYLPPNERCRNSIRADEAEGRVWEAIEKFLKNPELIADKVAQQQATAAEQLAHLQQQMAAIDGALAKCDREEQRWREAYAAEVISLEEFKGFRGNIAATRQALHAEQRQFKAEMSAVQLMSAHAEAIVAYCARVHAELKAFDMAGKRDALEWFEARATLAPDKSIDLEITLDSTEIVYLAPQHV